MAATLFLNIDLIEQPVLIQHKLLLETVTFHILRDEIFCNASTMCKTPLPILYLAVCSENAVGGILNWRISVL